MLHLFTANELKETLISGKERWEKQKNEIRSGYHQNVCVKQRPSNGKVCIEWECSLEKQHKTSSCTLHEHLYVWLKQEN